MIADTIINNLDVYKDASEYVERKENFATEHADGPLRILDTSIGCVSPEKMPRQHVAVLLTPYPPANKRHKAPHVSTADRYANVLEAVD